MSDRKTTPRRKPYTPANNFSSKPLSCFFHNRTLLTSLILSFPLLFFLQSHLPGIDSPVFRKVSENRCPLKAGHESVVNITTKALYDAIEFKDEDGGVWKQGWDITYQGNEWDNSPLQVFIVPHSHNDPGWLRTLTEYYEEKSRKIITNIVEALMKDSRRRFIWEEMSFLQLWWDDACSEMRSNLQRLIRNGQLEIVGGGWVMNDEANSHYYAIMQQITEGTAWLMETVGVMPRNSWSIDPFGHSPTMAYLFTRMGFRNMVIQRTHYEVKKSLARAQSLEFFWRQSWDPSSRTDIFCHMMPFFSYDIPHTCGPNPAVCCQFDFNRPPLGHDARCPWKVSPQEISPQNVAQLSQVILDQWRKKSMLYKTNSVLVPLGSDFRYAQQDEAETQFSNYERIMDHINSHGELKAHVQFGTLEEYFTSVRAESRVYNKFHNSVFRAKFPSLSGDFFTYADVRQDYWSGYYTSRPYYKAMDRVLEASLRGTEMLLALTHAHRRKDAQAEHHFPYSCWKQLTYTRRSLALFQHHDGVTGTARNHVVEDYGRRLHTSLSILQDLGGRALSHLLSPGFLSGGRDTAIDANFFEPEAVRADHSSLPTHLRMTIRQKGKVRRVVIYNSLEEASEQVVSILVDSTTLAVLDSNRECVQCQVSPEWDPFTRGQWTGSHRLTWLARVAPLGITTYFLSASDCQKPFISRISVSNLASCQDFRCPDTYTCTYLSSRTGAFIWNQKLKIGFSSSTGLMTSWKLAGDGEERSLQEEVAVYHTRKSGAYLFHPIGNAEPCVDPGGPMFISRGPLVSEVHSEFNHSLSFNPLIRIARLYSVQSFQSHGLEMSHRVQLDSPGASNHELIVRYKTKLDSSTANSSSVFYSDLNGYQMARREHYSKIPLEGNYYPMPAMAFLQGKNGVRFSVITRQAVGVASLQKGWLEMMLERRLLHDDRRGLGQGVTDNHPTETTFLLLLEEMRFTPSPLRPSSILFPSLLAHRVEAMVNYPLTFFFGKEESGAALGFDLPDPPHSVAVMSGMNTAFSPISAPIPCDYHIVSMKLEHSQNQSEAMVSLVIRRRAWDQSFNTGSFELSSKCTTAFKGQLRLIRLFRGFLLGGIREMSLRMTTQDQVPKPGVVKKVLPAGIVRKGTKSKRALFWSPYVVKIEPMEMKAFHLRMTKRRYPTHFPVPTTIVNHRYVGDAKISAAGIVRQGVVHHNRT